jgi:transcriptional regulator with XRE-family HTH domain
MSRTSFDVDPTRAAQARISAGLTQALAADELEINRVTMNKIENGKARVSLDLLERMAQRYGRSRAWLIGEPEAEDEIEASRERIANALSLISQGFEELVPVLNDRVREAREAQEFLTPPLVRS